MSEVIQTAPVQGFRATTGGRARTVQSELLKIWTTKTWWVLGIFALLGELLAELFLGIDTHDRLARAHMAIDTNGLNPDQQAAIAAAQDIDRVVATAAANLYTGGQYIGLLIVMILGVLIVTNEFAHQTATATFLATPKREHVIFAKIAAVGIMAAGLWLVTTLLNLIVGSRILASENVAASLGVGSVDRAIAVNLLAYVLWGALGIGFGLLLRNQTAAVITTLLLYLIGSLLGRLLFALLYLAVKADWAIQAQVLLPTTASAIMVSADPELPTTGTALFSQPAWWVGALILVGWGLAAAFFGTLVTRNRDIS